MVTIDNEYYLRSSLLLIEGGAYITKEIIFRELPKRGGDLDALLKDEHFKKKVTNEFKNKNQKEILFPTTGKTDVNKWDVSMLTGIILILFWSDLETKERKHVKEIKRLRIVIAHSPSATLHEDEYNDIADAIRFLASKFENHVQDKCVYYIMNYKSCPLDTSIKRLQELKYRDDQFRKILEEIERSKASLSDDISAVKSAICTEICSGFAQTEQNLSKQIHAVLERMIQTEPLKRIRAVVKSRIKLREDEEVDDFAEEMLVKVMEAAKKKTNDPSDPEEVRRAVDELFEEFDKIEDVKVLSVMPECIIIRIQCETYKSLYDVLSYVTSSKYRQRLTAVAEAMSSHLQTSKALVLHSDVPEECLQNIADGIEIGNIDSAKGTGDLRGSENIPIWNQGQSKEGESIPAHAQPQGKKLVVAAIDIGTTFTAYAYSFESDFKRDHMEIHAFDKWVNMIGIPTSKTPTVVLFDKAGKFHSFGYDAQTKYAELMEEEGNRGWKYFSDLSLIGNKNQTCTVTDDQNQTMEALDVYAAILKYLKDHFLRHLVDRLADLVESDIHWVLPVSASWSVSERKLLEDAAEKAGLTQERLTFVVKSEAAAIYCKEDLSSKATEFRKTKYASYFSPGAQFIVLHAGGRTVNVTSHEVQSDGKLTELLRTDVLSPMDGSWGGSLVDAKLNTFLEGLFGADVMGEFRQQYKTDAIELQHSSEMMKIQCKDPENEKEDFKIWLKVPATLLKIFKNANGYAFQSSVAEGSYASSVHVKRRNLMYLSNDLIIEMYKESKEKLARHLREILRDNSELKHVKTIIMTGGLANSEILKNEVRLSFQGRHVVVPDKADLAVVKGAVMCGFNTKLSL